jgi:hypothetical protein
LTTSPVTRPSPRSALAHSDHRLAGVDPDADLEVELRIGGVQLRDRVKDAQPGANGPLRVVLVRDRSAEGGHDRVTDELLDHAAEALDLLAQAGVVRAQPGPHVFGVLLFGLRSEPD